MIKIVIADDQELIRESLKIVLGTHEDLKVVDVVSDGFEVLKILEREKVDIILMDIRMPGMDGVYCTKVVKEKYPHTKVIILTTFDDDDFVFRALKYGASGYLLKGISIDELTGAITKVYQGTAMINEDIASKVVKLFSKMAQANIAIQIDEKQTAELKNTEWKIISLVGRGLSNKEIAKKLKLSEGTVRNGLSNILSKLNLRDRTQVAIWAVQTNTVNKVFEDEI